MKNTNTNTRKKIINQPNNKTRVKRCMETFAEKKTKYWTQDYSKQIKKLENKNNLTKEEQQLLNKLKKQLKEQIKILKKNYKLINCNINCKNTLLEPGPANKIPKEFQYSKELIKIFTKRRKDVFKNKTNILKDNFYENIPEKDKNKLLKEGAISDCVIPFPNPNNNLTGGSVIFKDGK
jgi:isoleucyl-tRNA synthetase